jgi:hypothetical protein
MFENVVFWAYAFKISKKYYYDPKLFPQKIHNEYKKRNFVPGSKFLDTVLKNCSGQKFKQKALAKTAKTEKLKIRIDFAYNFLPEHFLYYILTNF